MYFYYAAAPADCVCVCVGVQRLDEESRVAMETQGRAAPPLAEDARHAFCMAERGGAQRMFTRGRGLCCGFFFSFWSCVFAHSCKAASAAPVVRLRQSPALKMSEQSCRTARRHQSCSDLENSPTISERPRDSSTPPFIIIF